MQRRELVLDVVHSGFDGLDPHARSCIPEKHVYAGHMLLT